MKIIKTLAWFLAIATVTFMLVTSVNSLATAFWTSALRMNETVAYYFTALQFARSLLETVLIAGYVAYFFIWRFIEMPVTDEECGICTDYYYKSERRVIA
jgi:hypothetical protein